MTPTQRLIEAAQRLVEHADFKLGGALSADSKAREIPSNAASSVKARHLASLRDALQAALAEPAEQEPVATIPPGYKLVPVEPTDEMIDAAKGGAVLSPSMAALWHKGLLGNWAAMLAAAPEAPQPAKRVPLTNADLKKVIDAAPTPSNPHDVGRWVVNVCRAIEAAHGITKE
jgi:hypothetical protein